jgi:sulfite reductase (NADPH) flavoprotein alpha-component
MYSRTTPYISRISDRSLLTSASSTKKTYHICLEIDPQQFHFQVGDSIGVIPTNDPEEVSLILQKLGKTGAEEIFDPRAQITLTLSQYLLTKINIHRLNSSFLKNLFEKEGIIHSPLFLPENKKKLIQFVETHTLFEILHKHTLKELSDLTKLMPLLPRFYSIANSSLVFPNEIHLTVAYVHYISNGQIRRGVGSRFLCDLGEIGSIPVPIYVQSAPHFRLPEDPNTPIILVGPGTGIAPYRAFLQERMALTSNGPNWLFFGERNRASDFYYEPFWTQLEHLKKIRIDLAFSRDGKEKSYVQHKMYENKKDLWDWIQKGAYFYVCGNADKMAKDVEAMLQTIIHEEGNLSVEEARLYIKKLRVEKRYLSDVY